MANKNVLITSSAKTKSNRFAKGTENVELDQRNGGTPWTRSQEESEVARMSALSWARVQSTVIQEKYRSGVFRSSADSHTTRKSCPCSEVDCPMVLIIAEAHNPWSRWASLSDAKRFLPCPGSSDQEAVWSFIATIIQALSMKTYQYDPYPKGITLNELQ